MKQTLILFFTTLVIFFASDVHGQFPYAANVTVNITLSGCGVSKLCVQTPDGCDPAGNGTCMFGSSKKSLTTNTFSFQLSGNSTGYIGMKLTTATSQGSLLLACSNSSFYQIPTNTTNGTFASPNVNETVPQGQVSGNNIQCQFNVAGLNSSNLRSLDTSFIFQLVSGILNPDGSPGSVTFSKIFGLLDLANPAANIATSTSAPSNTTAASNSTATPSGANRALHSDAVLLLMSVLTLSILKTV